MDHHGGATPAPGYEDQPGQSLAEAAAALGISKDAARRRLKTGKLAGHQVAGSHGPEWCVHPDQASADRHGSATPAPTPTHVVAPPLDDPGATVAQPPDVAALVGLVDRLTVENGELRTAVAAWQSQAVVLAARLSDAQERLAIAVPAERPQAAEPGPQPVTLTADTRMRRWRPLAGLGNDVRQALAVVLLVAVALSVALWIVWPR